MEERNKDLEHDGLHSENDTHEWFNDKSNSEYAQTDNGLNKDALSNITCFVLRNKSNGQYERVVIDSDSNEAVYSSSNLDNIGSFIESLKMIKRLEE